MGARRGDLVTIGEFSRLTCISPRMLRHYGTFGLLLPELIDEPSGYRWYGLEQLADARRVVALREARVPVAQMAALVRLPGDSREFHRALRTQRESLVNAGQELQAAIARIDALLADDPGPLPAVRRVRTAEREVASARGIVPDYHDTQVLWDALSAWIGSGDQADGGRPGEQADGEGPGGRSGGEGPGHSGDHPGSDTSDGGPPGLTGSVCHDPEYREQDCDLEMWIETAGPLPPATTVGEVDLRARTLPAADALQVEFHGDYIGVDAIYEAIGRELAARGLRIAGPTLHTYHPGPPGVPDPADWVTDVAVPVTAAPRPGI